MYIKNTNDCFKINSNSPKKNHTVMHFIYIVIKLDIWNDILFVWWVPVSSDYAKKMPTSNQFWIYSSLLLWDKHHVLNDNFKNKHSQHTTLIVRYSNVTT